MSIAVRLSKSLGGFRLETEFTAGNETLALLGASGCGKSMTLQCIAGVVRPDRGSILVDGEVLFDAERNINLPPQKRRTGLMFQNYALFPHMTVLENIQAGAAGERDAARRRQAAFALLERFGLEDLARRYPAQLSGGQRQRAALARMLASKPRILMLDEPFSALDSHLRFFMEQEMRRVIREFAGTVLLVSHDRDEVFRMSDRIAVMGEGQVERLGTKEEVFRNPGTRNAAVLTGCKNISPVQPLGRGYIYARDWGVALRTDGPGEGEDWVGLRMHGIRPGEGENSFLCTVEEVVENPFSYTVMLRPDGNRCRVPIGWELDKKTWETIRGGRQRVCLPPEELLLLKG